MYYRCGCCRCANGPTIYSRVAYHFLTVCAQGQKRALSSRAERLLRSYRWPGNVRELRNLIQRAVLLSDHQELDAEDFPIAGDALREQQAPDDDSASSLVQDGPEYAVLHPELPSPAKDYSVVKEQLHPQT
jgi:DNA-binding NtrC family response regulator